MPLFTRELKSVPVEVKSVQDLTALHVEGDLFKATYVEKRQITDDRDLPATTFTADRSIAAVGQPLLDWIAAGVVLAEQFRQEDEAQRAADKVKFDAEAVRWAALTPDEKKAEVDAARQAALDAQAKLDPIDPTPGGVAAAVVVPAVPLVP